VNEGVDVVVDGVVGGVRVGEGKKGKLVDSHLASIDTHRP